jgi:hypothetical protein
MQLALVSAQLVEQLSQGPRQLGVRAYASLQPFANGIADRSGRLVID